METEERMVAPLQAVHYIQFPLVIQEDLKVQMGDGGFQIFLDSLCIRFNSSLGL